MKGIKYFIVDVEQFESLRKEWKKEGVDLGYVFVYPIEFSGFSMKKNLEEMIKEKFGEYPVVKYEQTKSFFKIPKHKFTFYGASDAQHKKLLGYLKKNRKLSKVLDGKKLK